MVHDHNYEKLVELARSSLLNLDRPRRQVRRAILQHPYFEEWLAQDPERAKATARDRSRLAEQIITLALEL